MIDNNYCSQSLSFLLLLCNIVNSNSPCRFWKSLPPFWLKSILYCISMLCFIHRGCSSSCQMIKDGLYEGYTGYTVHSKSSGVDTWTSLCLPLSQGLIWVQGNPCCCSVRPSLCVSHVLSVVRGRVGDSWSITCHWITCVYMTQQWWHPTRAFTHYTERTN